MLTRDDIALGRPLGRHFFARSGNAHNAALTANTPKSLIQAYEPTTTPEASPDPEPEEGGSGISASDLDGAFD